MNDSAIFGDNSTDTYLLFKWKHYDEVAEICMLKIVRYDILNQINFIGKEKKYVRTQRNTTQ